MNRAVPVPAGITVTVDFGRDLAVLPVVAIDTDFFTGVNNVWVINKEGELVTVKSLRDSGSLIRLVQP